MVDEIKDGAEESGEESFAELFAASQSKSGRLQPGAQIQAKVLHVSGDWVFLDIGQKGEGVLDRREVTDADGNLVVTSGDSITAWFTGSSKGELRFTTKIGGTGAADRSMLEEAWKAGIPVEGAVEKEVKGGFEVRIGSSRAFAPYSQMSLRRVADSAAFVGQKLKFMIIEYAEGGRNLIVSHRAILEEEAAREMEQLRETLTVGMTVPATVTSLQKFGAFVRAGAIEGLLPISEIGWTKVRDVADVLSVGQEITVTIKSLDWEQKKFSFSLKDTLADPWESAVEKFTVGSCHTGTVSRLAQFGAFVTIGEGVDGLLHISKIGKGKRINHPKDVLREGETVEVLVEGIDRDSKRISLSLADVVRAEAEAEADMASFRQQASQAPATMGTLGDLLKAKFNK
ncbi:MAG TPA: 30S ribosomal protein S1 [Geobacteraceae bacterium]|nr:30S ribosomal protein S1 [Geobacteraceae bacterium]